MKLALFTFAALIVASQHIANVAAVSSSPSEREASEEREIELTNRYHLVVQEGISREDAMKGCRALRMRLAVIPTMRDRKAISYLNTEFYDAAYWIGAQKAWFTPSDREWQWDADFEPIPSFSKLWMQGEPKKDPYNQINCLAYEELLDRDEPLRGFSAHNCAGSDKIKGYICEARSAAFV